MTTTTQYATVTRGDIAKAIASFHRTIFNVHRIAGALPSSRSGTIGAAISLLVKAGAIRRIERHGHPGVWYKTDETIARASDPPAALVKAIESQGGKRQARFNGHLKAVVPEQLRGDPRHRLIAYIDFSQRAISVKKIARLTRQPVGVVSGFCQALVKCEMIEWVGNRVRKTPQWNLPMVRRVIEAAASEVSGTVPRPKTAGADIVAVAGAMLPEPSPEAGDESEVNGKIQVVSAMIALLSRYSVLEILEDYKRLRVAVREHEAELARYRKLGEAFRAAGINLTANMISGASGAAS